MKRGHGFEIEVRMDNLRRGDWGEIQNKAHRVRSMHSRSSFDQARVNRGRLVMKAGGLQRTNSLFWFMACHMTAKVHIISRRRAASSFARSVREFILFLRMI